MGKKKFILILILFSSVLFNNSVFGFERDGMLSSKVSAIVESIIERVTEFGRQNNQQTPGENIIETFDSIKGEAADDLNFEAEIPNGNDKYLILVNQDNHLSSDYVPEKMINIADYVKATKNQVYMEEQAGLKYIEMVNAMALDGIHDLAAISGFRTYDYQSGLFSRQIGRHTGYLSYEAAAEKAARVVAPPGTSEHQTGLALDVSSANVGYSLSENFENTAAYQWLAQNSYKYGYIIRYTREKSHITGIIYEPWHIRYVGEYHAKQIYDLDLCLEEYIEKINME